MIEPVLYLRIKEELAREIRAMKPHDRIPSERELADRFQVSTITTKNALNGLAVEGMVYRIPGKGTFVAEPKGSAEAASASLPNPEAAGPLPAPAEAAAANGLIGFIAPGFDDRITLRMLGGVESVTAEAGYGLWVQRSKDQQEREQELLQEMTRRGVAGVVIFPVDGEAFNAEILRLTLTGFPIVLVDRYLRRVETNCVYSDNLGGAQAAVEHLIALGHRRIGLVSTPRISVAVEDRIEGYERALAGADIPIDRRLWLTELTEEEGESGDDDPVWRRLIPQIRAHLAANPDITALFAMNIPMARATMEAAAQLGLAIPADLSLVCFDAPEDEQGLPLPLTSVIQAERELGVAAAQAVLGQIHHAREMVRRVLPTRLMIGPSTAPPPASPSR
ncbi:MAG: GntR family transcriptional regulator [Mycobacterium leprae]